MSHRPPVPVHSIQEEHLYILLQRCSCGQAYELVSQALETAGERYVDRLTARCHGCGSSEAFRFDVTGFFGSPERYGSLQVNPTPEASRAIDLEGWTKLGLFYLNMIPQAADEAEKAQVGYMAAQCIEEALKLLPPGADTPACEAFFSSRDPDRRQLLCGQETFRASYLKRLRHPLPPTDILREQVARAARRGAEEGSQGPAPDTD